MCYRADTWSAPTEDPPLGDPPLGGSFVPINRQSSQAELLFRSAPGEGNINMPCLKLPISGNQRDLREAFSLPFMFLCKNIILLHACIYIGMYVWKKGGEGYTFALAKEIS